jgi:hypothetical protein
MGTGNIYSAASRTTLGSAAIQGSDKTYNSPCQHFNTESKGFFDPVIWCKDCGKVLNR